MSFIPMSAKVEFLQGESFIKIREAARLADVHPAVLEMADRLLRSPSDSGAKFVLATAEMQKNKKAIRAEIAKGLNKTAKRLHPEPLRAKCVEKDNALHFFFVPRKAGAAA